MAGRINIYKNGDVRGNNSYPPEVEIWLDAFERAIRDIRLTDKKHKTLREDALDWLESDHFLILGSLIYGPELANIFKNWGLDGAPGPDLAQKRRSVYEVAGLREAV